MIKIITSIFLSLMLLTALSTDSMANTHTPIEIVKGEKPSANPQFPGGQEALVQYIQKNIIYPMAAQQEKSEGIVHIGFVIDQLGYVVNAHIVKGLGNELDYEALRVVTNMPRWSPGKIKGIEKGMHLTLPVRFEMN